jgi:D-amino peptidase
MSNRLTVLSVFFVFLFATSMSSQTPSKKLKIFISADMEGVTGVVTGEQLSPTGFEYQRFREIMTQEVTAAVEAAFSAGATEIVVADSHGNGQNLLIEKLPKNITLVRAWPRPLQMMQGIDETFAGAIFLGYHAGTTNPTGVRAHTISSANLAEVKLNGVTVPEAGINAAIAGHFNVPVIMISGDDAAAKEATDLLGNIETAVVKWNYGFHSARTMMPEPAQDLIREKVKRAVGRISEFKPYKLTMPIRLDVTFKNYRPAEVLSYLSIIERTDAHSIRFQGKDMVETSKFITFMMNYESGLTP